MKLLNGKEIAEDIYRELKDRINDLSPKQDSIRANVTHIASKIQTINDKIDKIEGEIGIKKAPPADVVKQIIIAGI